MPIQDFFKRPEFAGNHPLLRIVAARRQAGERPVFELYRPREALGFRKAKIYVHFFRGSDEVECKQDDWDDDLNTGLIHLGVRSSDADAEKDRFVLGLRAALQKPEKRYGDGFFNSVFVQFVGQTEFNAHPDVKSVLVHVPNFSPYEGRSYPDCLEMIREAISGRASELTEQLEYNTSEAWDILAKAVAEYIDERFSVTNRRLLGLL